MKILVLGGTRYFGKRLVNQLINDGHQVTVASTGKTQVTFSGHVDRLTIERRDFESMFKALAGQKWDIVFDQICFDEKSAEHAIKIFGGQIGRLIFTSTLSVYDYGVNMPESAFDARFYQGNPANPNPYQEGKRLAEAAYIKQSAFPVTTVRFPLVLGDDDHTRRLHWHVARVKYGEPIFFSNINAALTFMRSDHAAASLVGLINANHSGPINVGSSDPINLSNMMRCIEEAVESSARLVTEPTNENHSPFGVEENFTTNVSLARRLGLPVSATNSWLPDLIRSFSAVVDKSHLTWSHPRTA